MHLACLLPREEPSPLARAPVWKLSVASNPISARRSGARHCDL